MLTRTMFVAAFLVLACLSTDQLGFTAAEAVQSSRAAQPPGQQPPSSMQEMKKMHEQMMAEMKAADARLEALVTDMNASTGEAKVDAIAAVVHELVGQQKAMHAHMGQMHQHMMGGMMMQR